MQGNLYVGVSAQVSLQRRLETIAHNVANASTVGFRAEEARFETLLSQAGTDPVAFAVAGPTFLSRRSGELARTENLFDVAVEGDAWLAIQTPAGPTYTRDGRMKMAPTGELQTLNGYPVLDAGGATMLLDANAGPPRIARDGTVTQGNRQVGAIGLFNIDSAAKLTRGENSGGHSGSVGHAGAGFHQDRHAAGLRRKCQCQRRDGDDAADQHHARVRNGLGLACCIGNVSAGSH